MTDSPYFPLALEMIPRVLSRLDRDPYSRTYGCFDWMFWHDKVHDIPSGHDQELVYVLALLYAHPFPDGQYFRSKKLLEWIKAAVLFWIKMRHRDGSLDEFYPFERQYGATAITAWTVAETFKLVSPDWTDSEAAQIKEALSNTGQWLAKCNESTRVANHQAQSLLALYRINQIMPSPFREKAWRTKLSELMKLYHSEGWFEEYGGFDPGYQTTTVSFLASLFRETGLPELLDCLKSSSRLLSYCLAPDQYFGGVIGSRTTSHIWPLGFEIMSAHCPVSAAIAAELRRGFSQRRFFLPQLQERYFGEQIYNFLATQIILESTCPVEPAAPLPKDGNDFVRYFPEAGMFFAKNSTGYIQINCKKGGTFHYAGSDMQCSLIDHGNFLETVRGRKIGTTAIHPDTTVTIGPDGTKTVTSIEVRKTAVYEDDWIPSPFKMVMFRMISLFLSFSKRLSRVFRTFLSNVLITRRARAPIVFTRKIILGKKLEIFDAFKMNRPLDIRKLTVGGVRTRLFVPYARSFHSHEMSAPYLDATNVQLDQFNRSGNLQIVRSFGEVYL